jgi:tripartite-type tricarboxylate transporter receptor subunit TctC
MLNRLLLLIMSCALNSLVLNAHAAESYPTKPVRMIVPFAPGGATDLTARVLAQKLSETWGKAIVIDNRSGAAGVVGTETVAKASPDGYTILFGLMTTHAVNPAMIKDLPFDPIKDFTPVTLVATSPQMLVVHPSIAANTLQEFITLAKASPGKMTFGSSGYGSSPHLAFEMFMRAAGIKLVHVPYKGTALANTDLVAGRLNAQIGGVSSLKPFVTSGRMRALAMASKNRSEALPNVPTMGELGLSGMDISPWFGLFFPAKTPKAVIDRTFTDTRNILNAPEMRQKISEQGAEVALSDSPQQFATYVAAEKVRWAKIVSEVLGQSPQAAQ